MIGSGTAPDIGLTTTQSAVPAASVLVSPGSALVYGTEYQSDANVTLTIAPNGTGNPRIDTVVLTKDWVLQTVRLAIVQGTAGVTPAAPALTQVAGTKWQIPLADVAVANAFVTITNANITPRRAWANQADGIALLDVKNNSGGSLVAGDVVIRDTSADRSATTTTTACDYRVIGVWQSRTANAGYGRVIQRGIAYVNMSAATTRGNGIGVSATAKMADPIASGVATTSSLKIIGIALETTGGAGLCLCAIDVTHMRTPAFKSIIRDNGANYTTTSVAPTFVAVDNTNLTITLVIEGTSVLVGWEGLAANLTLATGVCFDITVDGTRQGTGFNMGLTKSFASAMESFSHLITGLTPGSHTFVLVWATDAAGTVSMYSGNGAGTADAAAVFWAMEVG